MGNQEGVFEGVEIGSVGEAGGRLAAFASHSKYNSVSMELDFPYLDSFISARAKIIAS